MCYMDFFAITLNRDAVYSAFLEHSSSVCNFNDLQFLDVKKVIESFVFEMDIWLVIFSDVVHLQRFEFIAHSILPAV
jgi:hypothetical protein